MKIWQLRGGADRRFKAGHPWAYSNELTESPKGITPGQAIELRDTAGKFLARGYGNPNSLIAFRALSRNPSIEDPTSKESVLQALLSAGRLRKELGMGNVSHRLSFGEADFLPGLVIDRYSVSETDQVFVVQAHTAGMDRLMPEIPWILEKYVAESKSGTWAKTAVVARNDMGVRKLEGLTETPATALKELPGADLSKSKIRVFAFDQSIMEFEVDLIGGQKTGFFLDQTYNIHLAIQRFHGLRNPSDPKRVRILDLCCYVGQWSAQFARAYVKTGLEVEVTVVDASAQALERAKKNVEAQGARCEALKRDVLKELSTLSNHSFDLVISDPPALIKGRKDIPTGTHAYLQLNTQVFRLVRPEGAVVSCSCSGLLEEESFLQVLTKAAARNQRRVRWVARGSQSPDHPMLSEFPEGRYLKCWSGFCD